jgi:predicted DNA-binding transcriptional regulator AlpA
VTVVTAEEAKMAILRSGQVATLLGVSQSYVLRISKEDLDYYELPSTGPLRHRRYRMRDVREYARTHLGIELEES